MAWLSFLIWFPIAAGILLWLLPKSWAKAVSLLAAVIGLAVGIEVAVAFIPGSGFQFKEEHMLIGAINSWYVLGVDGISLPFVLLNNLITLLVLWAGFSAITHQPSRYASSVLIMSGLINGTFLALDALLFYVFFEAMLIPMFLLIGIWGGPRRVYAATKFFLYTLFGSVLLLVGLIYLFNKTGGSFSIESYWQQPLSLKEQSWLFFAFLMAFAVKVPMWPVHTWLPDAHVEAPTGGSVILAAITLKMGGYGLLRFILPTLPDAVRSYAPLIMTLSVIAIVYIGIVALAQKDMKKLIAYSSISHMGFVTLGAVLGNIDGLMGSLVQMISHGFISAAMFFCVGVLYERLHSREIADYGGLATQMPRFAMFFVLFSLANTGLPATSGFVGEFLVILGSARVELGLAAVVATSLVIGAAYTLWLVKRVIFGTVSNPKVQGMTDLNLREWVILSTLAALVLYGGLRPLPLAVMSTPDVQLLHSLASRSKLP